MPVELVRKLLCYQVPIMMNYRSPVGNEDDDDVGESIMVLVNTRTSQSRRLVASGVSAIWGQCSAR